MAPRKNDIIAACVGLVLGLCFSFIILPMAHAADLSIDPADGSTSSSLAVVEEVSSSPEPEPDPVESASLDADSDSYDKPSVDSSDIVFDTPVEVDSEPDTYDESEDVVVNRADLQEVVDLLNDLSAQLALYASEVPAGYEPTEADLEYRDSLLSTLSGIHDSLLVLTEPPVEETTEEAQEEPMEEAPVEEQAESDASAPVGSSAPADTSAPAETDPADSSTSSADGSADASMVDDTISEQDFYRLVLALLLVLVAVPFVGWVYKFISSFFPV